MLICQFVQEIVIVCKISPHNRIWQVEIQNIVFSTMIVRAKKFKNE